MTNISILNIRIKGLNFIIFKSEINILELPFKLNDENHRLYSGQHRPTRFK